MATVQRPEIVTSPKNPLLRQLRRAAARGTLTEDGCCVAESFHLLEEAIRSDCPIPAVLCSSSVRSTVEAHVRGLKQVRVFVLPDDLFAEVSVTEASQGVIALVKPPCWTMDHLFRGRAMVVVLDGLQDPGNLGAILRAAEAFGATGALLLKGTVSPFNPKALRASAGSIFRLPLVSGVESAMARAALAQHRLDIYAATAKASKTLNDIDLSRRLALVIGSEAHGISQKLSAAAMDFRIVTTGVESLNAAMAAAVILHEASRQRIIRQ
ncbi:MAG: RNA methyltransferase [Acidobacteriia bacterium]|nr:RNA methyltransferase [Terriglobia bacterium]